MISYEDAKGLATKVDDAASRIASDYAAGDTVHEDPTSGQLAGRLKETLHDFETATIKWQTDVAVRDKGRGRLTTRQLTSKIKDSEESYFGADLVFCLDIQTPLTRTWTH